MVLRIGVSMILAVTLASSLASSAAAQTLRNSGSGSVEGAALEEGQATVTLVRAGSVVTSVLGEVGPDRILAGSSSNAMSLDILPTIGPGDSGVRAVELTIPPGFSNVSLTRVVVGGTELTANCPSPGANEFCADLADSELTVNLGSKVTVSDTRIRIEFTADAPASAGLAAFGARVIDLALSAVVDPGDADGDPQNSNDLTVEVLRSQGITLRIENLPNKSEVVVGETVVFAVPIHNLTGGDILDVRIDATIPTNFKYIGGTTTLDGAPAGDPQGSRTLRFPIGTVPALVDENGNGSADPGEVGYRELHYMLVAGSGVTPGTYVDTAVATDYCDDCFISNHAAASIDVVPDSDFDLGTILGKVFEDANEDGWQDAGEGGVARARVALDDGSYVTTDDYGRFHFPVVEPGQRLLKLDLASVAGALRTTTEEALVVRVTPGLLVQANFGIIRETETERVGRSATPAVQLAGEIESAPLDIVGNTTSFALLVNGAQVSIPSAAITMRHRGQTDRLETGSPGANHPAEFHVVLAPEKEAANWTLAFTSPDGERLGELAGDGSPPGLITWDGQLEAGHPLLPGEHVRYQLEVNFEDGTRVTSSRQTFGVVRSSLVSLNLTGEAFESNTATLSQQAKKALANAATTLREHPTEKIAIEGHTDSVGSDDYNRELSLARAVAAMEYLTGPLALPSQQFEVHGFGETRPLASNDSPEGRALNRRVEIHGTLQNVEERKVVDQYRAQPSARVNGREVELDPLGRFFVRVEDPRVQELHIELTDSQGRSLRRQLSLPYLDLVELTSKRVLAVEARADSLTFVEHPNLTARTAPGNHVFVDGKPVSLGEDGVFRTEFAPQDTITTHGILVHDPNGTTRVVNLRLGLEETSEEGLPLETGGVPVLQVEFPPLAKPLPEPHLAISGETTPGNRVEANGKALLVLPDGKFSGALPLPFGKSRVVVEAIDPTGERARIERNVEVASNRIFLLAFADGRVGMLHGSGYLEGAGLEEENDFFTEGRVAYYLKGHVRGKFLVTSAFDSERGELDTLFEDFGPEASERFFRNLDPNKLYPVYGDESAVTYDTESQGKFYLAVESSELRFLVGNEAVALDDTELARYTRALYGVHASYRSEDTTPHGGHETEVQAFGADVRQIHVRNELRATGGSMYYLSHDRVIEGSERVVLVVRDKRTGLVLRRANQRRETDYDIKYDEGRILFRRPISSVEADDSLVDEELLAGNPVHLEVDYEATVDSFDKTASGARARQALGEHLALGGTYVSDEGLSGSYELKAVDGEVRLGEGSRVLAEWAQSEGVDAVTFVSDDGGLRYQERTPDLRQEGNAWKVAAEVDIGEWWQRPGFLRVDAYYKDLEPSFISNGNFLERGTEKAGANLSLDWDERNKIHARVHHESSTGVADSTTSAGNLTASAQWDYERESWGLRLEYLGRNPTGRGSASIEATQLAALELHKKFTAKLRGRAALQETFTGSPNDRATLGVEIRPHQALSFELEGSHGDRGSAGQAAAILAAGGSRIYLAERLSDGSSGSRVSTVVGAESRVDSKSRVYTEYQWERSAERDRTISLLGVQRNWDVSTGWKLTLGGEFSDVDDEGAETSRSALVGNVAWGDRRGLTAESRNELRLEEGGVSRIQHLTTNRLDVSLTPDFTLEGLYRYSRTKDRDRRSIEARLNEGSIGIAFRPVHHDRVNGMARYTRLSDLRPERSLGIDNPERTMDVVSLEGVVAFAKRVQWYSKGAARILREDMGSSAPEITTHTSLGVQRIDLRVLGPLDVGLEYRILRQREADDLKQGFVTELSRKMHRHLRIGAGYNFTDFSDDEFSTNDHSVHGWYLRAQGKY